MAIKVGNKTVHRYTLHNTDGDAINISGATSKQIVFISPYGAKSTYDSSFTTDGTDGGLEYRRPQPAPSGLWRAEVYIAGVSGFDGASATDQFPVEPRI